VIGGYKTREASSGATASHAAVTTPGPVTYTATALAVMASSSAVANTSFARLPGNRAGPDASSAMPRAEQAIGRRSRRPDMAVSAMKATSQMSRLCCCGRIPHHYPAPASAATERKLRARSR
jgi:hypothetical protein